MAESFFPVRLLAVVSFRTDAKRFIEAGSKGVTWASGVVDETGSFEVNPQCLKAGAGVGFTPETVSSLFKVAEFIYDHSRHEKVTAQALMAEVEELASSLKSDVDKSMLEGIAALIEPKAKYDRQRLIKSAISGGPDSLDSFSLSVNVRAVTEAESGRFLGFVPAILGRVSVRKSLAEEESLNFRLDKDDLTQIKETAEKALAELESVTKELKDKLLS